MFPDKNICYKMFYILIKFIRDVYSFNYLFRPCLKIVSGNNIYGYNEFCYYHHLTDYHDGFLVILL